MSDDEPTSIFILILRELLHAHAVLIEIYANLLEGSMFTYLILKKRIKILLSEEKFLKIKQVVEEEQTQPEYLQEFDDESLFEEEIQKDEFNSFSNPLYDIDDEIITNESYSLSRKDLDETILIPPGIDEPCFNAESDLLESLLNRDSPIDSTKTDSIFDEFSFPRLPEEHNSENADTIIESLLFSYPWDFRFLEELLINDSLPLPENESYNLNSVDNPESPVVKSCFDFEPGSGRDEHGF
ncbi:hypothetical protein Tco_0370864 [Tanacetum coccineum]